VNAINWHTGCLFFFAAFPPLLQFAIVFFPKGTAASKCDPTRWSLSVLVANTTMAGGQLHTCTLSHALFSFGFAWWTALGTRQADNETHETRSSPFLPLVLAITWCAASFFLARPQGLRVEQRRRCAYAVVSSVAVSLSSSRYYSVVGRDRSSVLIGFSVCLSFPWLIVAVFFVSFFHLRFLFCATCRVGGKPASRSVLITTCEPTRREARCGT
jgi:hypothetical protein